jgi:hypothetical protein
VGILSIIGKFLRWITPGMGKKKPKQLGVGPQVTGPVNSPPQGHIPEAQPPNEPLATAPPAGRKDTQPLSEEKDTSQEALPAPQQNRALQGAEAKKSLPAVQKKLHGSTTQVEESRETRALELPPSTQSIQQQAIMGSDPQKPLLPPGRKYSNEFVYLDSLIRYRIRQALRPQGGAGNEPAMPPLEQWSIHLRNFISGKGWKDDRPAMTLILVALAPYVYPDLFDDAIFDTLQELKKDRVDRIGGVRGKNSPFFLPTGETAVFLIGGNDHSVRQTVQDLFGAEHDFWEKKILWLEDLQGEEPPMHGKLIMSTDYVDLMTTGNHKSPQFSISFPARKIPHTSRTLDDLIVSNNLKIQIAQIKSWLMHKDELHAKFGELIKKGYRTLFYGPPGTGKTFTAMLLGKDVQREVYKIDLSMIVSKYIGETEKNLEQLFSRAKDKNWILFFDEADALFGKRTNVRDAHDKYANQEVSYLLQRIEDYDGLVILATNMKNNIDDAFCRRFNSVLHFPFPEADHRYILWIKSFFPKAKISAGQVIIEDEDKDDFSFSDTPGSDELLEIEEVAEAVKKYELSGGSITNVVQYAIIKGMERYHALREERQRFISRQNVLVSANEEEEDPCNPEPEFTIYLSEIIDGIRNELIKEGKPFR